MSREGGPQSEAQGHDRQPRRHGGSLGRDSPRPRPGTVIARRRAPHRPRPGDNGAPTRRTRVIDSQSPVTLPPGASSRRSPGKDSGAAWAFPCANVKRKTAFKQGFCACYASTTNGTRTKDDHVVTGSTSMDPIRQGNAALYREPLAHRGWTALQAHESDPVGGQETRADSRRQTAPDQSPHPRSHQEIPAPGLSITRWALRWGLRCGR